MNLFTVRQFDIIFKLSIDRLLVQTSSENKQGYYSYSMVPSKINSTIVFGLLKMHEC